jgi:hypothetical protein
MASQWVTHPLVEEASLTFQAPQIGFLPKEPRKTVVCDSPVFEGYEMHIAAGKDPESALPQSPIKEKHRPGG